MRTMMSKDSQVLEKALRSADAVLAKGLRVNGEEMGAVTRERTRDVIYAGLRVLHAKKYYVENVVNLTDKHVETLVRHWWEKAQAQNHREPLQPSQNILSMDG